MTHKSDLDQDATLRETADVIIALLLIQSRAADIPHQASPAAVTEETDRHGAPEIHGGICSGKREPQRPWLIRPNKWPVQEKR